MRGRAQSALLILGAGGLVTLSEAIARFGLPLVGVRPLIPFPPEVLAGWLFAVIPMNLFTLGVQTLGHAAKWVAFIGTTLIWSAIVGAVIVGVIRLGSRSFHRHDAWRWSVFAVVLALVIEGGWIIQHSASLTASWAMVIPMMGYFAAARLACRQNQLPHSITV